MINLTMVRGLSLSIGATCTSDFHFSLNFFAVSIRLNENQWTYIKNWLSTMRCHCGTPPARRNNSSACQITRTRFVTELELDFESSCPLSCSKATEKPTKKKTNLFSISFVKSIGKTYEFLIQANRLILPKKWRYFSALRKLRQTQIQVEFP